MVCVGVGGLQFLDRLNHIDIATVESWRTSDSPLDKNGAALTFREWMRMVRLEAINCFNLFCISNCHSPSCSQFRTQSTIPQKSRFRMERGCIF